jgi:hypothetical protein
MSYRVRFMKKICDDTGHQHNCVEGIVYVRRAKSMDRALKAAQLRFERMKRIPRWDLYADTFYLDPDPNGHTSPRH